MTLASTFPSTSSPMTHPRRGFPTRTRWSLVERAFARPSPASRAALEELLQAYRAPLLDFARRLDPDPRRAEETVQAFLLDVVEDLASGERRGLAKADPSRGRFRSFLRTAYRHFACNAHDHASARMRGGDATHVDADDHDITSGAPLSDRLFDRAWGQALLDRALDRLGEEEARAGNGPLFEALRDRLTDDDGERLRAVGERFGMSEDAVKQALRRLWGRYGKVLRAEVAETVARPEDVDDELRYLRASWIDDALS
jgi:DNA-directed RNA polymerase specialized sigma24 family protein